MAPLLAAAIPTLVELIPNAIGWFGGDDAEKAAEEVLGIASKVTGIDEKDKALEAIQSDPNVALEFKKAVMADKHRLDEMFLADKKNAREMQNNALKQDDEFSKRFVYYFAIGWSIFAMLYLSGITFFSLPEESTRFADTILGFLLGTIISGIIQFFYGSSQGSKDKNAQQSDIVKALSGFGKK